VTNFELCLLAKTDRGLFQKLPVLFTPDGLEPPAAE
jgi:hypothetical protein